MHNISIVLNGTSSAGKSSLAREIQKQSGITCAHVQIDSFLELFNYKHITDRELCREIINSALSLFNKSVTEISKTRYPMIVDTVFQEQIDYIETKNALAGRNIYLVGVHCDLDILESREKERGDRPVGLAKFQYDRVHVNKDYDFEVDTSRTSTSICATRILESIVSQ